MSMRRLHQEQALSSPNGKSKTCTVRACLCMLVLVQH